MGRDNDVATETDTWSIDAAGRYTSTSLVSRATIRCLHTGHDSYPWLSYYSKQSRQKTASAQWHGNVILIVVMESWQMTQTGSPVERSAVVAIFCCETRMFQNQVCASIYIFFSSFASGA